MYLFTQSLLIHFLAKDTKILTLLKYIACDFFNKHITFHPFPGLRGKKAMNQPNQFFAELPEEALVSLFFSLIRMRQQMENEYYANPSKALAGAVVEVKKLIRRVEAVICSEALG